MESVLTLKSSTIRRRCWPATIRSLKRRCRWPWKSWRRTRCRIRSIRHFRTTTRWLRRVGSRRQGARAEDRGQGSEGRGAGGGKRAAGGESHLALVLYVFSAPRRYGSNGCAGSSHEAGVAIKQGRVRLDLFFHL